MAALLALFEQLDDYVSTLEGDAIVITNEDGIESYLTVSGEQILVEALLFPHTQVKDTAALNDEILRTHAAFPLSTVGVRRVNDLDYYTAFGALSSQSKEESILIEVEALYQNISDMLTAYSPHLH